jgi:hypothetical protein
MMEYVILVHQQMVQTGMQHLVLVVYLVVVVVVVVMA